MENFFNFITPDLIGRIIASTIVVALAVVIYTTIARFIRKHDQKLVQGATEKRKRSTFMRLSRGFVKYFVVLLVALIILQINGVNVGSVLAGIGIASASIGLASQNIMKDIVRGFTFVSDGYFALGDVVIFNGQEGQVIALGLKTTKIRELKSGNVISIANRNIEQIEVVSDKLYLTVPMPYEVSLEKAEACVKDIVKNVKKVSEVADCRYVAVDKLDESSINYYLEVSCTPVERLQVRRDALRVILDAMSAHNISVPYKQIDIHNK